MSADLTQENGEGLPASGLNRFVVLKNEAISLVGGAANDVIKAINVPAGFMVMGAAVKIVTACDVASSAVEIGDDADTDGYIDAVATDGAAGTVTKSTGATDEAYVSDAEDAGGIMWKLYTAANTIDVFITTMGSTPTTGILALYVWGVQVY